MCACAIMWLVPIRNRANHQIRGTDFSNFKSRLAMEDDFSETNSGLLAPSCASDVSRCSGCVVEYLSPSSTEGVKRKRARGDTNFKLCV